MHAGIFLVERPTFMRDLANKAANGARIRLIFGDPASREVAKRSDEEQLGKGTLGSRIRNALAFYRPRVGVDGVEMRFHKTTLYNSIFRFDDEMVVNTHVYGLQPCEHDNGQQCRVRAETSTLTRHHWPRDRLGVEVKREKWPRTDHGLLTNWLCQAPQRMQANPQVSRRE
ncbi:DUF5919 domain-containing protein [Lentzea sp. NPDC058436]|uniref:DUF5919 domain-containing protein n=1 Tax=Lentzea sp. NPDC058436 TaxID=3346499 RepID=UPI003664AAF7